MATPKVTYQDFSELFGTSVGDEAGFADCLPFAEAVVRDLTAPNEAATESQAEAWRRAVCGAVCADLMRGGDHGMGDVGGFSLGKFSVSGGSSEGEGGDAAMRRAARAFLVGSGLLCMGLGAFE